MQPRTGSGKAIHTYSPKSVSAHNWASRMQDKSEKASPVNTKNGFVRNTLQTSTRKIYRNRKKPERKTQREGPKKTRFFRPDLPIRPITGFFRKNSGVEKSRNLPRPPLSEKRHRPTPSEHRKMTLHLAGGIFFAIFVKDRRRFGNLSVQIRAIALGFHYFWSRQHGGPA